MTKPAKSRSLRSVLTRGLILIQILVLVSFTFAATLPIINVLSRNQGLDDSVMDHIARSISRSTDGGLELHATPALQRVRDQYPNFMFYAVDANGYSVSLGTVPVQVYLMTSALTHISSANLSDTGFNGSAEAIIRKRTIDDGPIWIVSTGGPQIGLGLIRVAFSNPVFVGLVLLLTSVTLISIPVLIRRTLRGVEGVAEEAEDIDVNKPGVRLSDQSVPSELQPLVHAFNTALGRIDDGVERQQRFMADAAHELRTPIAILQTRLDMLPPGEQRAQLELDVARLSGMANQLLDLHRMDLSPASPQLVDLVEIASEVTADIAPLAISAGTELSFSADAKRVQVRGDAGALSRAITNLVQNAMTHGGPNITIDVSVSATGRVRVSDTGPGIKPENREEIFWPFHRLAPLQHGAGLGLSLVSDIVRRHGGDVSVSSNDRGGAVFDITLPLAADTPVK
ncbi:HAMP domain-containing sensor histidine kinase [Devosia sp. SD17-2]|uniref:sensor histidine kinase n=1 Tax=Devosia sp. SD17-2 TaxID=2976459 RepID=UPI0023D85DA6|nr:HAMP domain-containing sensor histidine kinase [Devosia sp. SD17-2]WEJ31830.1 HAMP domain-containing histidine kinase [Devosia sp. SD17-2]